MEAPPQKKRLYVMGRLKTVASRKQRRGHVVTVGLDGRDLGSAITDSAGRFVVEWPDEPAEDGFSLNLLSADGRIEESQRITRTDLFSPPVISFSGDSVLNSVRSERDVRQDDRFEADGDYPLCVTSSCQQVTLTWTAPKGSVVSILSEGSVVAEGLGEVGMLEVFSETTRRYTRRAILPGASGASSDLTLEVRRYPAMSLVVQNDTVKAGSEVEFGLSTCCPAGEEGLVVTVLTSDANMVPQFQVKIPARSAWGEAKVRLGPKIGRAKLVATARGYTRDGVSLDLS